MIKRYGLVLASAIAIAGSGAVAQDFFDPDEFALQRDLMSVEPSGPAGEPWLQHVGGDMVDTAQYASEGPYTVCFSNAGVNNPWRVVGWETMQAEVELHPEIAEFVVRDAEGSDNKQIADIDELLAGGNCDALIVSPNTTAALTPAVERACEQLPVIVFDRGVLTDCPVTFIKPIGGYAFGIAAAEFVADNLPDGGNVLALRILPGVDVLETRWRAAEQTFQDRGINIIADEFTNGDRAQTKTIVEDYMLTNQIDAVWMDAGATSVAAIEAFEDAGMDVPIITGEDQQDFLLRWQQDGLTAVAPTYPTYQWRTPILASLMILQGEPVPGPVWNLPQPIITSDNLDQYVNPAMPPLHYALCGCEDMPGYPERWGGD